MLRWCFGANAVQKTRRRRRTTYLFDFSEKVCVDVVTFFRSHGPKVVLHPDLGHEFVQSPLSKSPNHNVKHPRPIQAAK